MSSLLSGHVDIDPSISSNILKQFNAAPCFAQVAVVNAAFIIGYFSASEFFVKALGFVVYFLYEFSCSHVLESVLVVGLSTLAFLLVLGCMLMLWSAEVS